MKHYKTKSHVPDHIEFFKKLFIRIFISLVLSLALAYLLKFFVIFPYKVKNDFMEPNIARNSNVFISYLFSREKLSIGDIILVRIHSDSSVLLARIVGIKGDRISIKNKKLFRNGNLISEKNNIQLRIRDLPLQVHFQKEIILKMFW